VMVFSGSSFSFLALLIRSVTSADAFPADSTGGSCAGLLSSGRKLLAGTVSKDNLLSSAKRLALVTFS
jgi:hypothetical protein